MWPWGHVAVGYLAHAGVLDRRFAAPPGDLAAVVLVVATQLPDLVDKPLAWTVPILPNGRSLGHSVFTAALLVLVVGWAARRYRRGDLGLAFGVGYVSHLFADSLDSLISADLAALRFLGWPLLPAPPQTGTSSILGRFLELAAELAAGDLSSMFALELVLVTLAALLWVRQGYPGLAVLPGVSND